MKTLKKSSNATRKSSQKRTNSAKTVGRESNGRFVAIAYVSLARSSGTGRFTGMSENIEKFEPVIIPGYKVRG